MNITRYIKESFEELNTNMTWISKKEAQNTTLIVAVFTVAFALVVFGVDKLFQLGLDNLFNVL